jgi:dihydroxyacetone kinase
MRGTIPLQARKGRASYLGPRSVGHQDPGATSTALMFAALERAVLADRSQRFAAGARRPVTGP